MSEEKGDQSLLETCEQLVEKIEPMVIPAPEDEEFHDEDVGTGIDDLIPEPDSDEPSTVTIPDEVNQMDENIHLLQLCEKDEEILNIKMKLNMAQKDFINAKLESLNRETMILQYMQLEEKRKKVDIQNKIGERNPKL